jgi:lysophospholipase L1-like esterase
VTADRLAALTLKAGAAACFGVSLLNLINVSHHAASLSAAASYYGLPIGAGLSCIAALWLPSPWRNAVSVTGVSLVFSLYMAELYLALGGSALDRFPGAPPARDARTKAQIVEDLRAQGFDASPYITVFHIEARAESGDISSPIVVNGREVWPFASRSRAKLVVCREGAEYLVYDSDEHGFNNPPGMWHEQPLQIAAVGDSFTHGECVSREKSFMGLVRARYPATLNLGVSGTGPLSQLAIIREYLPLLRPKVVLWVFFAGNDINDMEHERGSPLLRRYLENGFTQGLSLLQPEIDNAFRLRADAALRQQLDLDAARENQRRVDIAKLHHVRLLLRLSRDRQPAPSEASFDRLRTIVKAAKETVHAWEGQLLLVYLPSWTLYRRELQRGDEEITRTRVIAMAQAVGIPLIDVQTALQSASTTPLTLYQGHFNEAGNEVAANAILKGIAELTQHASTSN